jgi:2-amino-4-hydroxy-6-hydroxymethyldihydropteridine diphosphokinase
MGLAFIGLGSNLGNGRQNLLKAWQQLKKSNRVTLLTLSSPYLTEPVGMETNYWFTNGVGVLETKLSPLELLDLLLQTEKEMGRERASGLDRIIDLDLLYYDDLVISSPELTLPHPEIANRMFVLAPMNEVAPDHLHPVLQKTTRHMLKQLPKGEMVKKEVWQK